MLFFTCSDTVNGKVSLATPGRVAIRDYNHSYILVMCNDKTSLDFNDLNLFYKCLDESKKETISKIYDDINFELVAMNKHFTEYKDLPGDKSDITVLVNVLLDNHDFLLTDCRNSSLLLIKCLSPVILGLKSIFPLGYMDYTRKLLYNFFNKNGLSGVEEFFDINNTTDNSFNSVKEAFTTSCF